MKYYRFCSVALTVLLVGAVYAYTGGGSAWRKYQQIQAQVEAVKTDPNAMNHLITTLSTRLTEHGGDATGWYLLGKLYLHQGEYIQAADCFSYGFEVDPTLTALVSWQLYATFLANGERASPEVFALLQRAKRHDADSALVFAIETAINAKRAP